MRKRFFGVLAAGLAGLTLAGSVSQAAAEQSPAAAEAGSSYTAVDPVRVLDTRDSMPVGPGGGVSVNLADRVPAGTTAVVLNVTAVSPTVATFITAHDRWAPRPGVSNLNVRTMETRSNEATVVVDDERPWVTLYNRNGNVNLVADLVGYYSTGAGAYFNAVTPHRLFDTRDHDTRIPAGGVISAPLDGRIPADATAVAVNVTAYAPTTNTFLAVDGGRFPSLATSVVNVRLGSVVANKAIVGIDADDRWLSVRNNAGSVDAFVDLLGYYSADGDAFHPIDPVRAFDSRESTSLTHRGTRRVPLGTVVPAEAETVSFNLTGIGDYGTYTHLTAHQAGTPLPATSTLNLYSLQIASNQAVVPLGVDRAVDVYNHVNYPDAIVDVFGYFAPRA
ncbi:hypothetical protein [Actinophytocola algeriensis]|uniref:Uncharacterized protein n=1 Tax=Actinophytocola algeriensis TaxID=1768010 RepID=A0A7W7VGN2_9PSEU|nr:hypothetical protein [Actinophytocola algeriensis]MBB4909541.1 hypothetical protein [Actinophytocola algeriensis]MBE1475531.1 hypothetical protein [Actinophytocola algeriensis]